MGTLRAKLSSLEEQHQQSGAEAKRLQEELSRQEESMKQEVRARAAGALTPGDRRKTSLKSSLGRDAAQPVELRTDQQSGMQDREYWTLVLCLGVIDPLHQVVFLPDGFPCMGY